MPLPNDFAEQCLYSPDAWFVDDLLTLDREGRIVVASVDTARLGPLVDAQRVRPGHPKHLPGAVCVQLTATLGCVIAAYTLDMRPTDGWVGFGTHIHDARFPALGVIGPPVHARAEVVSVRTLRSTVFVRHRFLFTQGEATVYRSEQSAAWFRP